jgi:HAD superfamily hydrolase (TIGR01662 family)
MSPPSEPARRVRGVLFDWDGVLHDSLGASFRVYNKILRELGKGGLTESEFLRLHSANWYEFYMRIGIERRLWRVADEMWGRFYADEKTRLYRDARRCLRRLREDGYRIALVSNGSRDRVERELGLFGVACFFESVICSQNASELKPSPIMLVKALNEIGLKRKEAVYVGDSDVDIMAAKRACVASVAISRSEEQADRLAAARPDFIFGSLDEMIEVLFR